MARRLMFLYAQSVQQMKSNKIIPKTIDEYFEIAPLKALPILAKIRQMVKEMVPDAEETISYQMPCFWHFGALIYFAGFKGHIGIYPPIKGNKELIEKLGPFMNEKGNLKFLYSNPIPYELIGQYIRTRASENIARKNAKSVK